MADIRNLLEVKHQVIDIVKEAGDLLLTYLGREIESHSKGGVDFATEADDAIDKFLREKLADKFPHCDFLTEETAPDNYLSLKDAENLWIIDPIDGTANFSRGLEPFCISVALVTKGAPILGVIYEPTKKYLYHSSLDDEFAYQNSKKLKVSDVQSIEDALVVTGFPWGTEKRTEVYNYIGKIYKNLRALNIRGSAAQDLCEIASGRIDGFFITGIKPWDIAAGSLFVLKAGGKISRIDGADWNVFEDSLVFSNDKLHNNLLELLN